MRSTSDIDVVTVADVPDNYEDRLSAAPVSFGSLRLLLLERHDLVLAKLTRNNDRDRADVAAIATGRARVPWREWGNRPYFTGEVEPCINGMVLALAAYFGELGSTDGLLQKLLGEQLEDGGWNCEAPDRSRRSSFNTTISLLEALWEYECAVGPDPVVTAARAAARNTCCSVTCSGGCRPGR